jgi:hypothetical protein
VKTGTLPEAGLAAVLAILAASAALGTVSIASWLIDRGVWPRVLGPAPETEGLVILLLPLTLWCAFAFLLILLAIVRPSTRRVGPRRACYRGSWVIAALYLALVLLSLRTLDLASVIITWTGVSGLPREYLPLLLILPTAVAGVAACVVYARLLARRHPDDRGR